MFKKNMKKLMYIVLALLLAACEKAIIDEDKTSSAQQDANVILHFTQYETSPLSPLQGARGTLGRERLSEDSLGCMGRTRFLIR